MPFSSFFLDEEQPEVPEEKAESVPDQPLQEAWQGSAATWKEVIEGGYIFDVSFIGCRCRCFYRWKHFHGT